MIKKTVFLKTLRRLRLLAIQRRFHKLLRRISKVKTDNISVIK